MVFKSVVAKLRKEVCGRRDPEWGVGWSVRYIVRTVNATSLHCPDLLSSITIRLLHYSVGIHRSREYRSRRCSIHTHRIA